MRMNRIAVLVASAAALGLVSPAASLAQGLQVSVKTSTETCTGSVYYGLHYQGTNAANQIYGDYDGSGGYNCTDGIANVSPDGGMYTATGPSPWIPVEPSCLADTRSWSHELNGVEVLYLPHDTLRINYTLLDKAGAASYKGTAISGRYPNDSVTVQGVGTLNSRDICPNTYIDGGLTLQITYD